VSLLAKVVSELRESPSEPSLSHVMNTYNQVLLRNGVLPENDINVCRALLAVHRVRYV